MPGCPRGVRQPPLSWQPVPELTAASQYGEFHAQKILSRMHDGLLSIDNWDVQGPKYDFAVGAYVTYFWLRGKRLEICARSLAEDSKTAVRRRIDILLDNEVIGQRLQGDTVDTLVAMLERQRVARLPKLRAQHEQDFDL